MQTTIQIQYHLQQNSHSIFQGPGTITAKIYVEQYNIPIVKHVEKTIPQIRPERRLWLILRCLLCILLIPVEPLALHLILTDPLPKVGISPKYTKYDPSKNFPTNFPNTLQKMKGIASSEFKY